MVDVFKNPTAKIPESDPMIIRVGMRQNEIAGRTDNVPSQSPMAPNMSIQHVPSNKG